MAEKYDIPLTSLKTCFKGVYGMPVFLTYVLKKELTDIRLITADPFLTSGITPET